MQLRDAYLKVQALREGGAVKRCHARPSARPYNVAEHSFNALNLLLVLHPNPNVSLMRAVMWHDVPERWTGDMPAFFKMQYPVVKAAAGLMEDDIFREFDLGECLSEEERQWLKAVDLLEFWHWAREEGVMGNGTTDTMLRDCEELIETLIIKDMFPFEATAYYNFTVQRPLVTFSDNWKRVQERLIDDKQDVYSVYANPLFGELGWGMPEVPDDSE
ncbi:HD domain-containing protein [bacterium]|nr:HD domain-containing protein [bacterium]